MPKRVVARIEGVNTTHSGQCLASEEALHKCVFSVLMIIILFSYSTFLYIEFRGVRRLHHSSNILPIKQKFGIQVLVIRTHALALLRLVCSGLSKTET